ncbi:hypothetical protein H9Y04_01615 [Streptomyces sp. TRM66268-LWL]|uniref:Lipoprotein n=1 Tax=Streptomyces polyasparticus TaxID=2767826 RepID=A0ABR7SA75_9ACTN|nr:hypothetical protein [Streptomyces polyasparticus]MBC9711268.1 hypothetical protein [Streptomyces polyasparticus]
MRVAGKNGKSFVLGAAVLAALLSTTACESGADDAKAGGSKPSATATQTDKPSKPAGDESGTPAPDASKDAGSGGSDGGKDGGGTGGENPAESVCAGDGQGPYGAVESVNFGGEAPNTTMGLVLGHYKCEGGETEPAFVPDSATGAATNVMLDDAKLKVVVAGELAKRLGTKTPDVNSFVQEIAELQDEGKLGGAKSPQFYFQSDAPNPDAPDGEDTKIVYLHQIHFVIE